MNPCDWWTASVRGEVVFDCNVPLDYACNIGQRGDWAREVIKWAKTEDHTMLISAMAHGEILAVLRNLELRQIADSRKAFPKGPGDFAAVDAQVGVMSRDITHPETMPVGSQNVGATAADPPDPVEQRPTRMAARRIVMRKIPGSRHSRPRFRKDLTEVRATGPYRSSWRKSKPGFEMRTACRLCRLKAHVSNRYFSVQRGDPTRARNVVT